MPPPRPHRRPGVVVAALSVALGATACGGRPSTPLTPPAAPTSRSVTVSTPTPSPSTSPTRRAPRASDVPLSGVDPCSLVTAEARAARGITTADLDRGAAKPTGRGASCGFTDADPARYPNWGVQLWPTTSLGDFERLYGVPVEMTVGGFTAIQILVGGAGSTTIDVQCTVAVDTYPEQTMLVRADALSTVGADATCADANDLAASVVAALVAQG